MDTENLLKSLKEHKVEFVVIGATAFPVHGYARATLDIDIFIRPAEVNAQRTWNALKAFIHPNVLGISFEEVWKNKVRAKFGNTFVYFASLDDLIKMKRAAGRPKDLEDLKYLKKLKKL